MKAATIDQFIERFEGDQPPYSCPWVECARTFQSRDGLRFHIFNHHDGLLPEAFGCPRDDCDETFPTREDLVLHLSAGHVPTIRGQAIEPEGESPSGEGSTEMADKSFYCRRGCKDKTFPTAQGRNTHETRVHGPGRDTESPKPPKPTKPRGVTRAAEKRKASREKRTARKPSTQRPRHGTAAASPARAPDQELQRIDQILAMVEQLDPASKRWLADRLYREQVAS